MFEFKKLCNEYEKLNSVEHGIMLAQKSVAVVDGLNALSLPVDPVKTLVAFIIGSVASDGTLDEKAYLYIYPSLVKAFGSDYDFNAVKRMLKFAKDIESEISAQTEQLISVISQCDDALAADIVSLCLLITAVDGKITFKEKRYVKRLCHARA